MQRGPESAFVLPDRPVSCWRRGLVDGITTDDDTLLVHTGERAMLHVRGRRLVRGRGYAAAPAPARRELARLGAMLRLRQRGLFHLHAAGVVGPDGRAWLLAGESGSGKSTLAYALARDGWPVLGDDGVLIEQTTGAVMAHAWREPLQVSIELAAEFPELEERSGTVDWSDPRHRTPMPAVGARRAPVGALAIVRRAAHDALTPISPTEALVALIRQSPAVLMTDAHSARHLATLQALVTSVPVVRLEHTPHQLHHIAQTLTETQG